MSNFFDSCYHTCTAPSTGSIPEDDAADAIDQYIKIIITSRRMSNFFDSNVYYFRLMPYVLRNKISRRSYQGRANSSAFARSGHDS